MPLSPSAPALAPNPNTDTPNWLRYFQSNLTQRHPLPWDDPYQLTNAEKALITTSIQAFQLGESSEGTHLMRLSHRYAHASSDRTWLQTIKRFIGEEQRHARDLGRFMTAQGIPRAQQHWSDRLFRKARRIANLEVALRVLFTAELVATLYYPALGSITRSPLLHQLCRQITQDEHQHVRFQANALHRLRHQTAPSQTHLINVLHHLFFRATLLVVWHGHHSIFRAAGYTFPKFYRRACQEFKTRLAPSAI